MYSFVRSLLSISTLALIFHIGVQTTSVKSKADDRLYLDNYTAHTTFISWFDHEAYTKIKASLSYGLCHSKADPETSLSRMSPIKYTVLQLLLALSSGDRAYSQILMDISSKHNKTSPETLTTWLESNFDFPETYILNAVKYFAQWHSDVDVSRSANVKKFLILLSEKYMLLDKAILEKDHTTSKWLIENNALSKNFQSLEFLWSSKNQFLLRKILSQYQNNECLPKLLSNLSSNESFIEFIIENDFHRVISYFLESSSVNKCLVMSLALDANKTEVVSLVEGKINMANISCSPQSSRMLFHASVVNGRLDLARALLKSGWNVDAPDLHGVTPLYKALDAGKIDAIKFLIGNGADYNSTTSIGRTLLSTAIDARRTDIVRKLLNMGASPVVVDEDGRSPLLLALAKDDPHLLKVICRRLADIHNTTIAGSSLLHHAVANGSLQMTRTLLEFGLDVNTIDDKSNTPLMLATKANDTIKILYLVEYEAEVDYKDIEGNTALHIAVENSSTSVVKVLTILGADVNILNNRGHSPLYIAVKKNKHKIISYFVKRGADIHLEVGNGGTLLHLAAYHGCAESFEILLKNDLNLNSTNDDNETPLIVAVKSNKSNIITLIAAKGGNIHVRTKQGRTMLHIAVEQGCVEAIVTLLKLGLNQNTLDDDGKSALATAILKNDYTMVKEMLNNTRSLYFDAQHLILASVNGCYNSLKAMKLMWDKYGIDFHMPDWRTGWTPMTEAVKADQPVIVSYLKEIGSDIMFKTSKGDALLHLAAEMGSAKVLNLLIDWGLSIDDLNNFGETPLWLAAKHGHLKVMLLLIGSGADVRVRSTRGPWEEGGLLHAAAYSGNKDSVSWLLANGFDVDDTDLLGNTPLHVAAENGQEDVVRTLLDGGSSVDKADVIGQTSLHKAIYSGHTNVTRTLVEYGADVDLTTATRISPLHQAVLKGDALIAQLLINTGAELKTEDMSGWTPLHWAAFKGSSPVVDVLLKSGHECGLKDRHGFTPTDLANERRHIAVYNVINEIC